MRQLVVTEVCWTGLWHGTRIAVNPSLAHAAGVGCPGFKRLESLRQADLKAYVVDQLKSTAGVNSALIPAHSI